MAAHNNVVERTYKLEGRMQEAGARHPGLETGGKGMNGDIIKRLATLLSVKSLVTLVLTAVFAYMACTGQISQDFMTIYAVIIAFYFGTQSQKVQDVIEAGDGP